MSDVHENLRWLDYQLSEVRLKQEENERLAQEQRLKDEKEKEKLQEWKMQQEWNDEDLQTEMRRVQKTMKSHQEQITSASASQQHFLSRVFEEWKKDREEDKRFKQEVLVELKHLRDDVIEWKRRLYNKTVRFNEHPQVFIFGDDSGDSSAASVNNTNQVKKKEPVLEASQVPEEPISSGCDECSGMALLDNLQSSLNRLEESVPAFHNELEKIHQKVEDLKIKMESIDDMQKNIFDDTKIQVNQIRIEQKESFEQIQKAQKEELEALRNVVLQANRDPVEVRPIASTPDIITPSTTPLPHRDFPYNNNNCQPIRTCTTISSRRTPEPPRPPHFLSTFPTLAYRLYPEYYGNATRREALLGWINASTTQEEIDEKIKTLYRAAVFNIQQPPDQ